MQINAIAVFFALLTAQAPPPELMPAPAPETAEQAIDLCERIEYADPRQALAIADQGLLLVDADDTAKRGLLMACRGWSMLLQGDMDAAREITLEIDALVEQSADSADKVGLLVRVASLHYRGGDQTSALEAIERALTIAESLELSEELPNVLGNLAIYHTESGQFQRAIDHFTRILAMVDAGTAPGVPLVPVRYNLARAYLLSEQPALALPHLEWLVETMIQPGMEPRLATALAMNAAAHRKLGDLQQAEALLARAEALHREFDNPGERVGLLNDQALLARELGDLEAAERYARESLALARSIDYERSLISALQLSVDILALRGKFEEALALHREMAERNQQFLESSQQTRLNTVEARLGMQRQARELEELRAEAQIRGLQLEQELLQRRVAWGALFAVLVIAVVLAIWQRANQQRLLRISRSDPLTGLANRRYMTLQMHGAELSQTASPVLTLLDLDLFKKVNDLHGHDVGDRVLLKVSHCLQTVADRFGAICGRWGGEEFALFHPDADKATSLQLIETLRQEIAALEVRDNDQVAVPVSASFGFAPVHGLRRDSGQDVWEPALKCADQLLYKAKKAGRNRGFGIWPKDAGTLVDPLAMDAAIERGDLELLSTRA